MFNSVMAAGAKKLLLTIDEVGPMGGGDTIYERSHYCFYKEDGSVFDQGKYVPIILYICVGATDQAPINPYGNVTYCTIRLIVIMAYPYASNQSRV